MDLKTFILSSLLGVFIHGRSEGGTSHYLLIQQDGPPEQSWTNGEAPQCSDQSEDERVCNTSTVALYRYIRERDECEEFEGCEGRMNVFKSANECVEKCGGAVKTLKPKVGGQKGFRTLLLPHSTSYSVPNDTSTQLRPLPIPSECEARPTSIGLCRAMLIRFRFVQRRMECEEFVYGGCGATENIFRRGEECNQKCGGKIKLIAGLH